MSELQSTIQPNSTEQKTDISLSEWIFQRIRPFVGGRVLEVDNGAGHIAPFCKQRGIQTDVLPVDLAEVAFDEEYRGLLGAYNMVVTLHTVHQITRHPGIIPNCCRLLKQKGFLVIQMPLCTALYNGLDDGYRKWKLYNMQFIHKLLRTDFDIIKIRYCMVTDTQPLPSSHPGKYHNRVAVFNSTHAAGFNQEGICAIVVCQNKSG